MQESTLPGLEADSGNQMKLQRLLRECTQPGSQGSAGARRAGTSPPRGRAVCGVAQKWASAAHSLGFKSPLCYQLVLGAWARCSVLLTSVSSHQLRMVISWQLSAFLPNCCEILQGKSLAQRLAQSQQAAATFIRGHRLSFPFSLYLFLSVK